MADIDHCLQLVRPGHKPVNVKQLRLPPRGQQAVDGDEVPVQKVPIKDDV
jgi:hypothetical protein